MKTLYILRHAKSSWGEPGLTDFDRPLNKRGYAARETMAAYLEANGIRPDLVLCSPSVRTRETLEPLADVWGDRVEVRFDEHIYEAELSDLMTCLAGVAIDAESIMVIGHYPGVQSLALTLAKPAKTDDYNSLTRKYPTGALCVLEALYDDEPVPKAGRFELVRFVQPRALA